MTATWKNMTATWKKIVIEIDGEEVTIDRDETRADLMSVGGCNHGPDDMCFCDGPEVELSYEHKGVKKKITRYVTIW